MAQEQELTFENVISTIVGNPVSEDRTDEFYAVAQLLILGTLSEAQQKALGEKLMKMMETDDWWRSNGAFNDE